MKTKKITELKKEILVIETPLNVKDVIFNKGDNSLTWETGHLIISGYDLDGYTLLGKPDEIKEDDARELVEPPIDKWGDDKFRFLDYRYDGCYDLFTATESLLSALESEIYWVNPLNNKLDKSKPLIIQTEHLNKWKEAQEKTFNRNRTLIFVKN